MKAFVINLKRNPERLASISSQLNNLGIEFEVIEATDGKKLSEKDLIKLYSTSESLRHIKKPLTPGEIGCADSHLRIYEKIVEQNLPYSLVLEDDTVVDSSIKTLLDVNFLKKSNFDWLQIDYGSTGLHFMKGWIKASLIEIKKNPWFILYAIIKLPLIFIISLHEHIRTLTIGDSIKIVKFNRPLYLTSAYIITSSGARKLAMYGRPILFAADMLPNKILAEGEFIMRAVSPSLAHQEKTFSSEILNQY